MKSDQTGVEIDVSRSYLLWVSFLILSASLTFGCATVPTANTKPVQPKPGTMVVIESDPPNAIVEISDGLKCTTPCKKPVKQLEEFAFVVTKDGYEPYHSVYLHQPKPVKRIAPWIGAAIGAMLGALAIEATTEAAEAFVDVLTHDRANDAGSDETITGAVVLGGVGFLIGEMIHQNNKAKTESVLVKLKPTNAEN